MHLFIIPLLVMIVTQGIKVAIELSKGKFSWAHLTSYGGMPSSHAAFTVSLSYTIGYYEGISNPAFAVSLILFVIIIRDAIGVRHELGAHGRVLNKLIKELPDRDEYKFPVLSERLGHTVLEVAAGICVGLIATALIIAFFNV